MIDEYVKYFFDKMGTGFDRRDAPTETIEKYRGKLPEYLLNHWQLYGWCGYADGMFWTVNPEEYEGVLNAWIEDTPYMERDAYHIIGRGAFGDLYFWGERSGDTLKVSPPHGFFLPGDKFKTLSPEKLERQAQFFFVNRGDREENDFKDDKRKWLFVRALKKLGRLKHDEIYGFVPALGLGGSEKLENIEKLEADVHLIILAQVTEHRLINSSTIGAYM